MKIISVENVSKQFKTPKKFPGFIGAIKGLFTKEFYGTCYKALKKDGIMVMVILHILKMQ